MVLFFGGEEYEGIGGGYRYEIKDGKMVLTDPDGDLIEIRAKAALPASASVKKKKKKRKIRDCKDRASPTVSVNISPKFIDLLFQHHINT